jgi:prepilin-type N-terminal cleavage/methylation domain-containing protein
MTRRAGVTLVEVLVAIFVMGIGLLALLTLFPLGALSMAQAIRDDRCAHCAANAFAFAEVQSIRSNGSVTALFNNPGGGLPNLAAFPSYDGPSYPVFVDPQGFFFSVGTAAMWVGDVNPGTNPTFRAGAIPRSNLSFVTTPALAQRWFSLLDDIRFVDGGTPDLGSGQIKYDGNFTWAYLLRRPRAAVPSVVDASVVVFNQRPLAPAAGLNPREATYDRANFDTTRNVITLSWGGGALQTAAPQVRPGSWVLDVTIAPPLATGLPGRPHGYFYRVTEVTENGANSVDLSFATTFKDFPQNQQTNAGVVIVFDGVAEVFDKGSGWQP